VNRRARALVLPALVLLALAGCGRAPADPHTYEEYAGQLEAASRGKAFVYITSVNCPSCVVLHDALHEEIEDRPEFAGWSVVALDLLAYADDHTEEVTDAERDAALRAIRDRLGVYLSHAGIPKFVVALDGAAVGWGAGALAEGGETTIGFVPAAGGDILEGAGPFEAYRMIECLQDLVPEDADFSAETYPLEQAARCMGAGEEHAAEQVRAGRAPTGQFIDLEAVRRCVEAAGEGGRVTGLEVMECRRDSIVGANPVSLPDLFRDPAATVRCSQRDLREAGFQEECGALVRLSPEQPGEDLPDLLRAGGSSRRGPNPTRRRRRTGPRVPGRTGSPRPRCRPPRRRRASAPAARRWCRSGPGRTRPAGRAGS